MIRNLVINKIKISYRMTANRFDWKNWSNLADPDSGPGLKVELKR
jgi:hypothetical protein